MVFSIKPGWVQTLWYSCCLVVSEGSYTQTITMKYCIVLVLAFAAVALSMPVQDEVIPVLKREEVRDENGQYVLEYLSGDGTSVREEGYLVPGEEGDVLVKKGTIKYTAPDGQPIELSYIADQTGFHPTGQHLPVSVV